MGLITIEVRQGGYWSGLRLSGLDSVITEARWVWSSLVLKPSRVRLVRAEAKKVWDCLVLKPRAGLG